MGEGRSEMSECCASKIHYHQSGVDIFSVAILSAEEERRGGGTGASG